MKYSRRSLVRTLGVALLAAALAPPPVMADAHRTELRRNSNGHSNGNSNSNGNGNGNGNSDSARISRDEAAQIARRVSGGRVLGVELRGNRYYVRVLVDGKRIRTVKVDARSGAPR